MRNSELSGLKRNGYTGLLASLSSCFTSSLLPRRHKPYSEKKANRWVTRPIFPSCFESTETTAWHRMVMVDFGNPAKQTERGLDDCLRRPWYESFDGSPHVFPRWSSRAWDSSGFAAYYMYNLILLSRLALGTTQVSVWTGPCFQVTTQLSLESVLPFDSIEEINAFAFISKIKPRSNDLNISFMSRLIYKAKQSKVGTYVKPTKKVDR